MSVACGTGKHREHDVYMEQCPCRDILEVLANKWSALAIGALADGPQRYGHLRRRLERIAPKVLTSTLRRLEEYGFVERTVYAEVPVRVEYALTELGRSVAVPLEALRHWVEEHADAIRA
ncbi:winged helix-turn-helix transcriptional regulator [Nonomuraea sp. CA-141351]|uniref:winged helix-turn-helix transcriptional regulator n=1 Tax=Nonomuraea sp. CA-141351 TaxID=3239996 RepID=UPI003D90014E